MSSLESDRLLAGALVTWFRSCLDPSHQLINYWDLLEGRCLHEVYLKIDSQPLHLPDECDCEPRTSNLEVVYENIRSFYETELNSVVLRVPDLEALVEDPQGHVEEMRTLLILLLGCAVQCPSKDEFISRITAGTMSYQVDIMEHIKQVTQGHELVVSMAEVEVLSKETVFEVLRKMSGSVRVRSHSRKGLASPLERSEHSSLTFDRRSTGTPQDLDFSSTSRRSSSVYEPSNEGQVYKLRTELEKTKEAYLECLEELEDAENNLDKLKDENRKLFQEVKLGRGYRDKLDIFMEKSSQVDQLQKKLANMEQKAMENEFLRMRVQELLEDNKQLQENYEILYEQLMFHKSKADRVDVLEDELIRSKDIIENLSSYKDEQLFAEEQEVSFKKVERLDETGLSEPDLIAGVTNNVSSINLFQELSQNENRNLSERLEVLEQGRSVTSCVLHSKKIRQLQTRRRKLKQRLEELEKVSTKAVLETQRLIEQMTQWQCKAVLYETRWIVQRCKKAVVLDKDSMEISRTQLRGGKFDQDGNYVGFCSCTELENREKNFVTYLDLFFYNAVALGTAVLLKKIFNSQLSS